MSIYRRVNPSMPCSLFNTGTPARLSRNRIEFEFLWDKHRCDMQGMGVGPD